MRKPLLILAAAAVLGAGYEGGPDLRFDAGSPTCTLVGSAGPAPVIGGEKASVAASGTFACPAVSPPRDATVSVQYAPSMGATQSSGNVPVANNSWRHENSSFYLREGDQVTVNVTLRCPMFGGIATTVGPAIAVASCRRAAR